jgi:energy-coupling factor transport system ATP-binding protein
MIDVRDVRYTYPPHLLGESPTHILNGVSFYVEPGQCVALVGPNGSGKSTLCLSIAGLAPRLTSGTLTGAIRIEDRDPQSEPPGALTGLVGLVMQDPAGQLFNPTVEEEIAWGLENLGIPPAEIGLRINRALEMVGLAHLPLRQPPHTLSGGEQKRLILAAVLAMEPRILILDEPAGGLAPLARREMVEVLTRLRAELNLAILMVESDADVVAAMADHMLVLQEGHIVVDGPTAEVFGRLERERFPGIPFPSAAEFARAVTAAGGPHFDALRLSEVVAHTRRYSLDIHADSPPSPLPAAQGDSAFSLEAVAFAYEPSHEVLHGINLTVPRRQFAALTGDNGAGKTTLARHLIGLLRPTSGIVRVLGQDAAPQSIGQLARKVGFGFQNPELQIFSPTVRDEISFGPRNLGLAGPALDSAVNDALERFNLLLVASHPPAVLSFSARRMVALASIAAMQTPILVLDEPTVGLDAVGQRRVMEWLSACHQAGTTILLITHDMELVARYAERVIVLEAGRIAADGLPLDVFTRRNVLAGAGLEPPFVVQFAEAMGVPALAQALTPQAAAQMWVDSMQPPQSSSA